jgi:pimeloyl-ACP methyl ester carboxylesterase
MSPSEAMTGTRNIALLHGGGQGSWVWADTVSALRLESNNAANSVALDIPGCGAKRGRATEHLDPLTVARELLDDLERAGMRDIVLVGHSLAGNVLPAMAELRPDLIRRLVYVACSLPLPGQTVVQLMGNGLHGSNDSEVGWPVDPRKVAMRDRYDVMFCNDMTEVQRNAFLAQIGHDNWPMQYFSNTQFDFKHQTPATYVLCLRDRSLPVSWQETFASRFHADEIVRLDAGHQVMISRPHTLAEVLLHIGAARTPPFSTPRPS